MPRFLLVLIALWGAAPAFAGCPDWAIASTFEHSDNHNSDVLLGDLDANGAHDAVTYGAGVHVAYWGKGGFIRSQTFFNSLLFAAAAVADFNRDGRDDFLLGSAAGASDQSITLALNGGNGQFGELRPVSDVRSNRLAAANLDGDSFPDVIAIGGPGNEIVSLLNDGHGGFLDPLHSGFGAQPTILAAGDLNGDRRDDVIVIDPVRPDVVRAYVNDGSGNLHPFASATLPAAATAIAAADLDGDGRADVAAVTSAGDVVVLRSLPGGFSERARLSIGAPAMQIVTADFDRDGGVDLAVVSKDSIAIFLNDRRTFRRVRDVQQQSILGVIATELTGDALPDLLVRAAAGSLTILPGAGDGTFRGVSEAPRAPASFLRAADLDGDGDQDLVAAGVVYATDWPSGATAVMLNEGGTFKVTGPRSTVIPTDLLLDDLDGDGRPEIVVSGSRVEVTRVRDGKAVLDSFINSAARTLASGDFDGDGKRELVVSNADGGSADLYTFTPEPHFVAHVALPPESFPRGAADFDGDGRDDLLVSRSHTDPHGDDILPDGYVSVLPSLGHGAFGDPIPVAKDIPLLRALIGDFDGDHRPDIAIEADDIRIAYSTGRGFDARAITGSGLEKPIYSITAVADVDGDGKDEIFGPDERESDVITAIFPAGRGAAPRRIASFPVELSLITTIPAIAPFTVAELDGNPGLDIAAVGDYETTIYSGLCPSSPRRRAR